MKKKALAIIIVLAAAVGIFAFRSSFAWLPSEFQKSQDVSIGDLSYTFEGELQAAYIDENTFIEYAAPGENMMYVGGVPGTLKALNLSTITTNLRIRIDYTYYDTGTSSFVTVAYGEKPAGTDDFDVLFSSVDGTFEYNSGTKCWDFKPAGAPLGNLYEIPAAAQPVSDEISLINSMSYSSNIPTGSVYEDENVTVKLTVEAKQSDYVDWETVYTDIYGP
jgi:hypothetical protein